MVHILAVLVILAKQENMETKVAKVNIYYGLFMVMIKYVGWFKYSVIYSPRDYMRVLRGQFA